MKMFHKLHTAVAVLATIALCVGICGASSTHNHCAHGSHQVATSCRDVQRNGDSHGDDFYDIQLPVGTKYRAYCDMTLDGGGWTLFATKVTPSFNFMARTFDRNSPRATDYDAAGCVPAGDWSQILFRFRHDNGTSRVVYTRNQGQPGGAREALEDAVSCDKPCPAYVYMDSGGFYRHTPHVNSGARDPVSNFHVIPNWNVNCPSGQISESHDGSNVWLDMYGSDVSEGEYSPYFSDYPAAKATKCVAGSCYLEQPIWLMYR